MGRWTIFLFFSPKLTFPPSWLLVLPKHMYLFFNSFNILVSTYYVPDTKYLRIKR